MDVAEDKHSQFADDTQLVPDGTADSPAEAWKCVSLFYKHSGLETNVAKTETV